ncbi:MULTISPECIES: elongation factor P 5-aminopentanone reductase [Bacillaceae]|uniref:elongation factor P 5-aminopentanone reductase n=1 Tax=Bacillaceae TaxID=186817 RepID=UPI000BFC159D|nr:MULTISPECIES: SDR family oxidoreductase [Bacillaceae]PGT86735.1 3-oxoacyl-ACP reductase [Bacillus sp. AFS040349]UGB32740.1 SDR family oxidoreductase [Metabacillus sp. B2-18]
MDKYALITGASGDIGIAISKKLISEGYHLYVHYHQNEKVLKELKGLYNDNLILPIKADLTSKTGVQELLGHIKMPVELVVFTSGMSHYGLVTDLNDVEIDQMVELHITSPFRIIQKLIPSMITNRKGNILFISSIWGITGASCEVLYSMVKGGQNAYVKALAKELAPSHIRVNAIAPGAISTKMLAQFTDEEIIELQEEIPLGRLGTPDEIAEAVIFLASEKSSYITGQVISVNGGWI